MTAKTTAICTAVTPRNRCFDNTTYCLLFSQKLPWRRIGLQKYTSKISCQSGWPAEIASQTLMCRCDVDCNVPVAPATRPGNACYGAVTAIQSECIHQPQSEVIVAVKVFVSAGTPADDTQMAFRDAIVKAIDVAGLSPRLVGERDWDFKNPIRGVRRVLDECAGAIVIAYTRYRFPAGEELRKDGIRSLEDITFPTAWNQIEAAMAYEKGLPLLVVAQNGLRQDAVLEPTHDIRPFWADLDPAVSQSDAFLGYLRSWKQEVEKFANAAEESKARSIPPDISLAHIINRMPWYETVALASTLLGGLAAAATIGYRIGSGHWPFG